MIKTDKIQMERSNYVHELMIRRNSLETHMNMTTDPMIKGAIQKTILDINNILDEKQ